MLYSILHSSKDAQVGEQPICSEVEANTGEELWLIAKELGYVHCIINFGKVVFCRDWNYNLIGVDQETIETDQYGDLL